ncbi:MAG: nucleoside triphosphate pyrophosphohydrolase [Planctomycetota bacterium]|jgi:tetrapyrrole methylase family protein/MazG family protein|nr:nucleoside triphosphate pyrophosphohydrolase [Planctomycetota bacterium]MDP6503486.1 nucleoside triphosphate pyrophosphohydrolase [Planctomycetota bacterium]
MNSRQQIAQSFLELIDIMARLRSDDGCPWDRKQTHESLKRYLFEEAHELFDEIDEADVEGICGELGDLILQPVFHAQIASEAGQFDIGDCIEGIVSKLRHRHPHVFGEENAATPDEVMKIWRRQKAKEEGEEEKKSLLDSVPQSLPALSQAQHMTKECSRVGFDWGEPAGALEKVFEELDELKETLDESLSQDARESEMGDLFFALVNVSRLLGIDAEEALRKANKKFKQRFRQVETLADEAGRDLSEMDLQEMDELWDKVKSEEGQVGNSLKR